MPEETLVQPPAAEASAGGSGDTTPDAMAQLRNLAKDHKNLQAEFTRRSQELARLRQSESGLQSQNAELAAQLAALNEQLAAMPSKIQQAQTADYADEDASARTIRMLYEQQAAHNQALQEIVRKMDMHEQGLVLALTNDKSVQAKTQAEQLRNEIRRRYGNLDSDVEDMLIDLRLNGRVDEYAEAVQLVNQYKRQALAEQAAAQQRAQGLVGGAGGYTGTLDIPPTQKVDIDAIKKAHPHMHPHDVVARALRDQIRLITGV